jgi:DNA polymerase-3 subunit beta
MPQTLTTTTSVDRKQLLTALNRIGWVIPKATPKPILQGVRLETDDGKLRLHGTDLDVSLVTSIDAEGELPPCIVPYAELIQRVKSAKDDTCTLALQDDCKRLQINHSRVSHVLNTLDLDEYPALPAYPDGHSLILDAPEIRHGLQVVLRATAKESTRYAINGVLLEADRKGTRLVATDGRRLVIIEQLYAQGRFRGQVILPGRFAALVGKLLGKHDCPPLLLHIKPSMDDKDGKEPADLCLHGPDWTLCAKEVDGHFPVYRDVVPTSHSKFVTDRRQLIETLAQVAPSRNGWSPVVRVDLREQSIRLLIEDAEVGTSSGEVPAQFAGGGDATILTAFNHALLMDALVGVDGDRVVIDVAQNSPTMDGQVFGKPALICSEHDSRIRWVVMPVSTGLPASPETLGSNYGKVK